MKRLTENELAVLACAAYGDSVRMDPKQLAALVAEVRAGRRLAEEKDWPGKQVPVEREAVEQAADSYRQHPFNHPREGNFLCESALALLHERDVLKRALERLASRRVAFQQLRSLEHNDELAQSVILGEIAAAEQELKEK